MAISQSKDDDKVAVALQNVSATTYTTNGEQVTEIDEAYLSASWYTNFYRSVLLQMILFGA